MAHQSNKVTAHVTSYSPEPAVKDPVDTMPSDQQPPGVDEEVDYNSTEMSLEDALTNL